MKKSITIIMTIIISLVLFVPYYITSQDGINVLDHVVVILENSSGEGLPIIPDEYISTDNTCQLTSPTLIKSETRVILGYGLKKECVEDYQRKFMEYGKNYPELSVKVDHYSDFQDISPVSLIFYYLASLLLAFVIVTLFKEVLRFLKVGGSRE